MDKLRMIIAIYPFFFGALAYLVFQGGGHFLAWVLIIFSFIFSLVAIGFDKR